MRAFSAELAWATASDGKTVDRPYKAPPFKLQELICFDAVARLGSFQAAADALQRTHPSVFTAIGRMEDRLALKLLDRSGYRVTLTNAGRAFHARTSAALREMQNLGAFAEQLSRGEEPVLQVVIGDLCPPGLVLPLLSAVFLDRKRTRLHLDYEAVGGPDERLRHGTADLVFHRAAPSDLALERIEIRDVKLVPVCAPGFPPFPAGPALSPEQLRPFTQCVIRDTARDGQPSDYFLVDGAHRCSVADHAMKKMLILQGLAWGHLPDFLVNDALRSGDLISLQG